MIIPSIFSHVINSIAHAIGKVLNGIAHKQKSQIWDVIALEMNNMTGTLSQKGELVLKGVKEGMAIDELFLF